MHDNQNELNIDNTKNFAEEIKKNLLSGNISHTKLQTDQKVLARITDGIYRHVSSAIRELICNAYDADATEVYIDTDAPRFKKITIRDNGNGMSIDTLSNMLHHIGGSAKRNIIKSDLGVFDKNDPTISPVYKRKLIGKIGIGLFSVAQLTRDFTIITKQKGNDYYLIADINLNNYSEEKTQKAAERGEGFEAGIVKVYSQKAENINAKGTDIILRNIKKSAVDQLMSIDIWNQALDQDTDFIGEDAKPTFHIGGTKDDGETISEQAFLPWKLDETEEQKFKSFYKQFIDLEEQSKHPSLQKDLDNYLNIIWILGLSLPLKHIDKSPYEITNKDCKYIYQIQNNDTNTISISDKLEDNRTIKDYLDFKADLEPNNFKVVMDGVEIFRPIVPVEQVKTQADFKGPILFYGKYSPNLSKYDENTSGGNLSFEAFIKWSPRIIPKEHRGLTIRMHGATGALFDPDFMRWQLAEYQLKTQLLVEINVIEGFESALNIDRESFNIAHPHYQILMRWLHKALKQAVYTIKKLKKETRDSLTANRNSNRDQKLSQIVLNTKTKRHDENEQPAFLEIVSEEESESNYETPTITNSFKMTDEKFNSYLETKLRGEPYKIVQNKTSAIISILDKFKLLEDLSNNERDELFKAIIKVISCEV